MDKENLELELGLAVFKDFSFLILYAKSAGQISVIVVWRKNCPLSVTIYGDLMKLE